MVLAITAALPFYGNSPLLVLVVSLATVLSICLACVTFCHRVRILSNVSERALCLGRFNRGRKKIPLVFIVSACIYI